MPKEAKAAKMYDEADERWDDDEEEELDVVEPEEEGYDSDLEAKRELERLKGSQPSRPSIYEEEAMDEKVRELQAYFNSQFKTGKRGPKVPWSETLGLTSSRVVNILPSQINDDVQREVEIYNIALENAKEGLKKLKEEGLAIDRPDDYFVEMFKNDKVMQKIKNKLVQQHVRIQNFEEKKQKQDLKKISKQLRARQEFDKHREKRSNLEAIDRWRQEIREKGEDARDLDDIIKENRDKTKKGKAEAEGNGGFAKKSFAKGKREPARRESQMENSWRGDTRVGQAEKGGSKGRSGKRDVLADRSKSIRKGRDSVPGKGKGKAKMPTKKRLGKVKRQRVANKKRSGGRGK